MSRRNKILAGIAAIVVCGVAVAFGCLWRALDPGALRRIVVSNVVHGRSEFWQIVIDDTNRYIYLHGAVEDRGRIAFAPFAARLASAPELRLLAARGTDPRDGLAFWVEGRRRTVAPFLPVPGTDHAAMRDVASALHDAVAADVRRKNAPVVSALTSLRDLRSVEAFSNGCYGPCGIYTIALRSDGGGSLLWRDPPRREQHRAVRADWNALRGALHAAHVERLERKYATMAVDTQSAALRFTFPRFSYTVQAPDSSTWPPEFHAAFGALRHAAAAAEWSPPLSAYQMERMAR